MSMVRIDKYLADMDLGTRSEVKLLLKKGLVKVNGEILKKPEFKLNTEADLVEYNGDVISYIFFQYFLLNKPSGYVSATEDRISPTVLDLIKDKKRKDLFPVGRLDKDTEGLLLITNDGELAHRLLSPKHHVEKTYFAKVEGVVTEADRCRFQEGLDIGEKCLTLPASLKILESGPISEIELTIYEGKFHQIKRMFEAVNKQVLYLKRISMGNLHLENSLKTGQYRTLTDEELCALRNHSDNTALNTVD